MRWKFVRNILMSFQMFLAWPDPQGEKGSLTWLKQGLTWSRTLCELFCLSGGKISSEAARQSSQEKSQVKKEERHNIRVETENVNNVALILEWWASFLGSHVNDVTLAGFTPLSDLKMSTAQFLVTTLALPLLLHSSKTEWSSKAEWKSGDDGRLGDLYWNTSNPMWDGDDDFLWVWNA